jgi:catalase
MPASTSFAQHSADSYGNYEKDRQMKSQETLYATSNGVPMPHPYETQRVGENGPLLLQDLYVAIYSSINGVTSN